MSEVGDGPTSPAGDYVDADEPGSPDQHAAVPRLYIASPLTGLTPNRAELLSYRIRVVDTVIEEVTFTSRAEEDRWPVARFIPWDRSRPRPGKEDGLSPQTIYEQNLDELLRSDGLIVVTDKWGSVGIGQEMEWAARSGLPILYLSNAPASRQILGNPHVIDTRVCPEADACGEDVREWLTRHRHRLQQGPARRVDRELAYVKITAELGVAWRGAANPTAIAGQLGLHPNAIWNLIDSPARVALTPWWTVCEIAAALGVSLDARRSLSFAESRAWIAAAEEGSWSPLTAERVRAFALTTQETDLELPRSWSVAHDRMRPHGSIGLSRT